jgi:hypothetical protein
MSIILGESQNEAVLLYKHYAVETLVITPCGHLYTQWALFAHLTEKIGKSMTQDELRANGFQCHCGANIGDTVAKKEIEAASQPSQEVWLELYGDIISEHEIAKKRQESEISDNCCRCGERTDISVCENKHRLCLRCLACIGFTRYQFHCPRCQVKVSANLKNEIIQCMQEVSGISREKITAMCDGCRIEAPFSEFEVDGIVVIPV